MIETPPAPRVSVSLASSSNSSSKQPSTKTMASDKMNQRNILEQPQSKSKSTSTKTKTTKEVPKKTKSKTKKNTKSKKDKDKEKQDTFNDSSSTLKSESSYSADVTKKKKTNKGGKGSKSSDVTTAAAAEASTEDPVDAGKNKIPSGTRLSTWSSVLALEPSVNKNSTANAASKKEKTSPSSNNNKEKKNSSISTKSKSSAPSITTKKKKEDSSSSSKEKQKYEEVEKLELGDQLTSAKEEVQAKKKELKELLEKKLPKEKKKQEKAAKKKTKASKEKAAAAAPTDPPSSSPLPTTQNPPDVQDSKGKSKAKTKKKKETNTISSMESSSKTGSENEKNKQAAANNKVAAGSVESSPSPSLVEERKPTESLNKKKSLAGSLESSSPVKATSKPKPNKQSLPVQQSPVDPVGSLISSSPIKASSKPKPQRQSVHQSPVVSLGSSSPIKAAKTKSKRESALQSPVASSIISSPTKALSKPKSPKESALQSPVASWLSSPVKTTTPPKAHRTSIQQVNSTYEGTPERKVNMQGPALKVESKQKPVVDDDDPAEVAPKSMASKRRIFEQTTHSTPKSPGKFGMLTQAIKRSTTRRSSSANSLLAGTLFGEQTNDADIHNASDFLVDDTSPVRTQKQKVDYFAALATPSRRKKTLNIGTPKSARRTMNALNIATPVQRRSKSARPRRKVMDSFLNENKDAVTGYVDSVVALLKDKSKKEEVAECIKTIDSADGFPKTRRLSVRDNGLISSLIRAIRNDPTVTEIVVDSDGVFGTVSTTLLFKFIDALRINMHLKKLTFRGVELGNDVLHGLAASIESNFVLKEIDLSRNCFTNEGLAAFCQALGNLNDTCVKVNLQDQTTPISVASQEDVLEAFRENRSLTDVQLDFQSEEGPDLLQNILERNKTNPAPEVDMDEKLLNVLRDEAEMAQDLRAQREAEEMVLQVPDDDWDYLYELAVLFDKHKLKKEVQAASDELSGHAKTLKENESLTGKKKSEFLFGAFKDILEESVSCFNSDGSFLTDEFIAKFLEEDPDTGAVVFDFHGQWKLFKRFPPQDPQRNLIVTKFVDAIVSHARVKEFTGINMANTGCGDDFLIALSDRCREDDSLLPNLQMINFETNFINETGVLALAKLIANPDSAKYLQVIRLENQKGMLKSKAEVALAKAMCVNRSVVVLGMRVRNLLERQLLGRYIVRNIDFIRKARQHHAKATGTQRKRNQVEQQFDSVAENDPTIDEIDMVGNTRFLTLTSEEKVKAASSFANNCFVKTLNLTACGIDDEFAEALGKSLETNETIEKVLLESNSISGEGIKALFQGLGKNMAVEEMRLHHQSKMIITSDEDLLADMLEPNMTITKVSMDLRTKVAQIKLDRKLSHNRNYQLKLRAEAKGDDFKGGDSFSFVKF